MCPAKDVVTIGLPEDQMSVFVQNVIRHTGTRKRLNILLDRHQKITGTKAI